MAYVVMFYIFPHKAQGAGVLLNDCELFVNEIMSTCFYWTAGYVQLFFSHYFFFCEHEMKFAFYCVVFPAFVELSR